MTMLRRADFANVRSTARRSAPWKSRLTRVPRLYRVVPPPWVAGTLTVGGTVCAVSGVLRRGGLHRWQSRPPAEAPAPVPSWQPARASVKALSAARPPRVCGDAGGGIIEHDRQRLPVGRRLLEVIRRASLQLHRYPRCASALFSLSPIADVLYRPLPNRS
jgi:hypothetical protein